MANPDGTSSVDESMHVEDIEVKILIDALLGAWMDFGAGSVLGGAEVQDILASPLGNQTQPVHRCQDVLFCCFFEHIKTGFLVNCCCMGCLTPSGHLEKNYHRQVCSVFVRQLDDEVIAGKFHHDPMSFFHWYLGLNMHLSDDSASLQMLAVSSCELLLLFGHTYHAILLCQPPFLAFPSVVSLFFASSLHIPGSSIQSSSCSGCQSVPSFAEPCSASVSHTIHLAYI